MCINSTKIRIFCCIVHKALNMGTVMNFYLTSVKQYYQQSVKDEEFLTQE